MIDHWLIVFQHANSETICDWLPFIIFVCEGRSTSHLCSLSVLFSFGLSSHVKANRSKRGTSDVTVNFSSKNIGEFAGYWLSRCTKTHISPANLSFSLEWTSFGESFLHMYTCGYLAPAELTHKTKPVIDLEKTSKGMAKDVVDVNLYSGNYLRIFGLPKFCCSRCLLLFQ